MEGREKLQNVWAQIDKQLTETTAKKTRQIATLHDELRVSSSDSDSESESGFTALPKEFRPNLNVTKQHAQEKKNNDKISPDIQRHQLLQSANVRKFTSSPPNRSENNKSNVSEDNSALSLLDTELCKDSRSYASNTGGCIPKIRNQTGKNMALSQNRGKSSEAIRKAIVVTSKIPPQGTATLKDNHKLEPKASSDIFQKESKNKKSVKYKLIQKHEQQNLKLNFDLHAHKDANSFLREALKYETKLVKMTEVEHGNGSRPENKIIKQKSKNGGKKSRLSKRQSPTQQGIIKWDSSLSLDSTENKIKWSDVLERETFLITEKKINAVHRQPCFDFIPKIKSNISPSHETKCCECTKPKITCTIKAMNTKSGRHNKIDTETFALKKNECKTDACVKYTYISRSQNFSCETKSRNAEESSCFERLTICGETVENNSRRSSTSEVSDFSPEESDAEDLQYIGEIKVAPKEERYFTETQQASNVFNHPTNALNSSLKNNRIKDLKEKNESILCFGKEVSNLIIGSYNALSILISFYNEWAKARRELLFFLEQLEKKLKESSSKYIKYTNILGAANTGATLAANIPHEGVMMAAKIVSAITSLFLSFLKTTGADKAKVEDSYELARVIREGSQTASELYMYGLQCNQQFEETTKFIKEFHSNADLKEYFDNEHPEITTFIRGFLEFPPHHRVFYRKLHKCFQELLQNRNTSLSRIFCEPFTFYTPAVEVISFLDWRFHHEDFNSDSVSHELEQIYNLIQNSNTLNVKDLNKRIQNCIRLLKEELKFWERCFKDINLFEVNQNYEKSH